ncbi:hypothetical protein DFH11DRAFT_1731794 [Phellopilus nigrolimitatus]|nr:hypothetical protein DFH11DRAFT_1731794 [Phellopilus nigrolimitatus]
MSLHPHASFVHGLDTVERLSDEAVLVDSITMCGGLAGLRVFLDGDGCDANAVDGWPLGCDTPHGFAVYRTWELEHLRKRVFVDGTLTTVLPMHTSSLVFLGGGGASPRYPPNTVVVWGAGHARLRNSSSASSRAAAASSSSRCAAVRSPSRSVRRSRACRSGTHATTSEVRLPTVNMQTQNDFSLHTLDGCTHPSNGSSTGTETGQLISTDCFNQTSGNQGCIVEVPGNSYGANFAPAGGGVYAMNWNDTSIYLSAPNPDGWGTPTALYPTSSCSTAEFIKPQTLILNITVCGDFVGRLRAWLILLNSFSIVFLYYATQHYKNP